MHRVLEFKAGRSERELAGLLAGKGDLSELLALRSSMEISESGELLLEIPSEVIQRFSPHPYQILGAPYSGKSPFLLREGVVKRLLRAQELLTSSNPGCRLKIFDGYRPLKVQNFMVSYTFNQQVLSRGLEDVALTEQQTEEIMKEVLSVWAHPSENPDSPPPHSTGAAVDLSIVEGNGNLLEMGGEIDEIGEVSLADYYADLKTEEGRKFHKNRSLLNRVMTEAGFERLPHEWWHFSYGDQTWAFLRYLRRETELPTACYGRVDLME